MLRDERLDAGSKKHEIPENPGRFNAADCARLADSMASPACGLSGRLVATLLVGGLEGAASTHYVRHGCATAIEELGFVRRDQEGLARLEALTCAFLITVLCERKCEEGSPA